MTPVDQALLVHRDGHCAVCGHEEWHLWHYVEDPAVLPDGTVLRRNVKYPLPEPRR